MMIMIQLRDILMRTCRSVKEHRTLVVSGVLLWGALAVLLLGSGMRRDRHHFEFLFFVPFLVYGIAIYWISKDDQGTKSKYSSRSNHEILALILVFSILFRALFILSPPLLSDDIYRYHWEGKLSANGINPYLHAPDDPELIDYRDNDWEKINNKDVAASYPPLTQMVFALCFLISPSVLALKLFSVLFDLLTIPLIYWILKRFEIDPRFAIIYAWSPLVVIEFAHSGHNDSLAIFLTLLSFVLLQKRMRTASALSLSLGFVAKLFPMLFAPILFRRWGIRNTLLYFLIITLCYLPFMGAGSDLFSGTSTYADRWLFNGSIFLLLESIIAFGGLGSDPVVLAKGIIVLIFLAMLVLVSHHAYTTEASDHSLFKSAFILTGLYLILTPTFHPWYIIWVIPYLCVFRFRSWLVLTGLVPLSYLIYIDYDASGIWTELWWVRMLEYIPFYAILMFELVPTLKSHAVVRGFRTGLFPAHNRLSGTPRGNSNHTDR